MSVMLIAVLLILLAGLILWMIYVSIVLNEEMKKNHVLQSFIAGIVRCISDYNSQSDNINKYELPKKATEIPFPYELLLENVGHELSKSLQMPNYEKWLNKNRDLFIDSKNYTGDGYNFMYWDLFDRKYKQFHSKGLISPYKKEWIKEDVVVNEGNATEIEGEVCMLWDFMEGKLPCVDFTQDNIDEKLALMFNHIRPDKLNEAKDIILKNIQF